ncbi:MAG TPA: hypothetical protein VJ521_03975 [Acidobacteriota bacterium]|nr:hypothetical protein [Acidobacteriota bacterium]
MNDPQLEFAPLSDVVRELLTPANFFQRMAEIEAAGGKIEMMERGKRNADWWITHRKVSIPQT